MLLLRPQLKGVLLNLVIRGAKNEKCRSAKKGKCRGRGLSALLKIYSLSKQSDKKQEVVCGVGNAIVGLDFKDFKENLKEDSKEVWGRPPPYAPQNGTDHQEEGRGTELLPATDLRERKKKEVGGRRSRCVRRSG